jgi:hypothetical protein
VFIEQPAAIVSGIAAVALADVLRRPAVQAALLALPVRLRTPELAAATASIQLTAAAYEAELRRNETNRRETATDSSCGPNTSAGWSTARVARHLQVSRRRVQQLARQGWLAGELVGGQWVIQEGAVREYRRRRGAAA